MNSPLVISLFFIVIGLVVNSVFVNLKLLLIKKELKRLTQSIDSQIKGCWTGYNGLANKIETHFPLLKANSEKYVNLKDSLSKFMNQTEREFRVIRFLRECPPVYENGKKYGDILITSIIVEDQFDTQYGLTYNYSTFNYKSKEVKGYREDHLTEKLNAKK